MGEVSYLKNKGIMIFGICVAFVLVIVLAFFFGGATPSWGHMWDSGYLFTGWMMPLGMIGMVAFWIFVAFVVFRFTGSSSCRNFNSLEKNLKERLSKGEITIQEYEEIYKKIKEEH